MYSALCDVFKEVLQTQPEMCKELLLNEASGHLCGMQVRAESIHLVIHVWSVALSTLSCNDLHIPCWQNNVNTIHKGCIYGVTHSAVLVLHASMRRTGITVCR